MRIGFPRALLYYHCFPLWQEMLSDLGHAVILSEPTTRETLKRGLERAVGEACLPIKLFFGHAIELQGRVDRIFMPRLVSLEPGTYICPKFMGLPAMIRASIPEMAPGVEVDVDVRRNPDGLWQAAKRVGHTLGHSRWQTWKAFQNGLRHQEHYDRLLLAGFEPEEALKSISGKGASGDATVPSRGTILLIGHPYNTHDAGFNLQVKQRLRSQGLGVLTMEQVDPGLARAEADGLSKSIFWSLGRRMVGTTMYLLHSRMIDGVVHLAAFGCGPDSMIGEVIERQARRGGVPFLPLVLDEHTGEAGFATRIEAFAEMLTRRIRK